MNLTDIQPENQQLKKRLILVVSKGTIDMLYPALVLATTAPAMGMKVDMYFTFSDGFISLYLIVIFLKTMA